MRSRTAVCALIALPLTLALAPAASAGQPLKRCAAPTDFRIGPFFGDQVRARAVSCRFARGLAGRWGRTRACASPPSPTDHVCSVGRYRCVYRDAGYETGRTTCKRRNTRKLVSFRFGS
jgi:hypothetical protein